MKSIGSRLLPITLGLMCLIARQVVGAESETGLVGAECQMSREVAVSVYDERSTPLSRDDDATVCLCAAAVVRGIEGYGPPAEFELIERAIASARARGQAALVADSLLARAAFHSRQESMVLFLEDWDEIADLKRTPGGGGRVLQLSPELNRFARAAYEAGDLDLAVELVSRLEPWLDGRYDAGFDEPDWLPELYADAGEAKHAEEIHRSRIENAQASGSPLRMAARLDRYATFLESQERMKEASVVRGQAAAKRQEANREQCSEEFWGK